MQLHSTSSRTGTDRTDEPPSEQPAIRADDVHVTYDDGTEAVQGVSFTVQRGEFFGFLGPNGAGKTTTIKTLATLLYPTNGTVSVNGYDVTTAPQAVCESIGYMAQETSVDEELTARENVRFTCEVYGVPDAQREKRTEHLLELVGLADAADTRAENFSGGMKKRLDAATVLVHRPPVVFLDEPTTGLDPEARMAFWDYLRSINDQGTTVFLTTQYLEEVDRLCDRLAVIQDGQLVATDTPASLKSAVGGDVLDLTLAESSRPELDRATATVRRSDAIDATSIEPTDGGIRITAENTREAAGDVFVALQEAGVTVTGFDVRSPTLDDVFLAFTGEDPDATDGKRSTTAGEATGEAAAEKREVAR